MSEGPIAGNVANAAADTGETQTTDTQITQGSETGTPQVSDGQGSSQQDGINPAWNPLLEVLPSSLHHLVIPHLSEWDKGVQQRFQQINEKYQPYNALVENGIEPEILEQAMGLYHLLDTNPQLIYEALVQQGFGKEEAAEAAETVAGQGQETAEESGFEDPSFDVTKHPDFQRMQQMVEAMAQSQLSTFEQEQTQQAEAEIDREFEEVQAVAEKHGIPFKEHVLARIMTVDPELNAMQAFEVYVDELREIAQSVQTSAAPVVLGGGGGVPSQQINPSQMTPAQRRAFVADTLRRAAQNNG